ncbi:leucine-rich repeat-containing protein 69 isoform X1 [Neophocaena asiaeorientalis asiaeorientalis]|uniref:Leucine-rich repeat-containing protein 69 isoform X1 n=1 Tax=Neophocaena asiaeorientalis asiaeorientalis TaxID=1706337 RepID=A0A341CPD4_NEOAA|nr:leucine-rich repeat-containing protein 69 isoform X1 [Neophocaena asiaeorientalis asiaeorientalis]
MAEKLLIRALKGGKSTKIVTLNGKNMTKMPSMLEKLPGLKTLDLQNNRIPKVCPEISTLTQLTALNLGNNLLEEVPEEMKYLTSLKKLHLFGNKIHRFASGVCDGLQNLILLNLNNNQLTWIPQEISRLKSLTYLSINHNQLASIPRELCFLENLSELQLNYNQLICIPKEINFLKKLQKLLLVRNNIESLPEGLCDLLNLRILDIAGNVIQIFPPGFQDLKLREFYCEGNPLFLKQPVNAVKHEDIWSLQEITSRFIMNQLAEKDPFLMQAIEWYPQVRNIISQGRKCAICGKSFLTTWLECVEFFPPSKNWKISRNLQLVPLRILICSYKCFNQRDPNLFGIAQV